jgi:hypothetical protein
MAVTASPYASFMQELLSGGHSFTSATYKVALMKSTYSPSLNSDVLFSSLTSNEVSGNGYTAGGETLQNVTISQSSTTAGVNADSVTWTDLATTCRYAVVYRSTGSKLVGLFDFGANRTYATEPFTLSFPSGVVTIAKV